MRDLSRKKFDGWTINLTSHACWYKLLFSLNRRQNVWEKLKLKSVVYVGVRKTSRRALAVAQSCV